MPVKSLRIGNKDYDIPDQADLQEIISILMGDNKMPSMSVGNISGYGEYNPKTNAITLSPYGGNTNTLSHELTHALNEHMGWEDLRIWDSRKSSPQEQRFTEAYSKLNPNFSKVPSLAGDDPYRRSATERRAFGVGNHVGGASIYPERPHMDATMATEAAILRDLFKRRK